MHVLEVVDGHGKKRRVPLDRPHILIGREPSCDIHLPHPAVSRRHAQLQKTEQGRWVLQDLSSRNRVYVEEKPVQQVVLEPRQEFRIAEYRLFLVDPSVPRVEPEQTPSGDSTGETGLIMDGDWLESLHVFQRNLLVLEDPQEVLEALAREVRRVARPKVLAIGLDGGQGYAWEVVETERDDVSLRDHLNEADSKLQEEPSSLFAWSSSRDEISPREPPGACMLVSAPGPANDSGSFICEPCGVRPV